MYLLLIEFKSIHEFLQCGNATCENKLKLLTLVTALVFSFLLVVCFFCAFVYFFSGYQSSGVKPPTATKR